MKRFGWLRYAALFAAFAAVGMALGDRVPWSDDARFYVTAAVRQGAWLQRLLGGDGTALTRPVLDDVFGFNSEHPPVAKLGMAATYLVLHAWTGWLSEIEACRAATTLLWAATAVALLVWLRRWVGRGAALAGTLAFVLLPRLLFEAHAETLDMPVTAMTFLSAWALFEAWEAPSRMRTAATVGVFGLALATKLNAPFVLAAALVYAVLLAPPRLQRVGPGPRLLVLPPVPAALFGMVLVSPLVAWLVWPWLWFDTVARLNSYVLFHLQHYGIYLYYQGVLWGAEPAPWHAPLVHTLLTVPLPVLLLAALGVFAPLRAVAARLPGLRTRLQSASFADSAPLRLGLFALLQAAVQLGAASLPGVPKYGGVKLFLPAFPFLALLCGLGFERVLWELERQGAALRRPLAALGLVALALPGLVGSWLYDGVWLSYYNGVAGGIRGATASGYERQYYDLAYPELWRILGGLSAGGSLSVAFAPNPKEYTSHLARAQREASLPRGVRLAPLDRADVVVLTHERRWAQYSELMAGLRTAPLLARYDVAGVPLFSVFDLRARRGS